MSRRLEFTPQLRQIAWSLITQQVHWRPFWEFDQLRRYAQWLRAIMNTRRPETTITALLQRPRRLQVSNNIDLQLIFIKRYVQFCSMARQSSAANSIQWLEFSKIFSIFSLRGSWTPVLRLLFWQMCVNPRQSNHRCNWYVTIDFRFGVRDHAITPLPFPPIPSLYLPLKPSFPFPLFSWGWEFRELGPHFVGNARLATCRWVSVFWSQSHAYMHQVFCL